MKELFEVEFKFSSKVSASPLAKGLTEPIVKILEKSVPLLERIANAYVEEMEKEVNTK